MVLVTAQMCPSRSSLVREHQACEARFYSTPDKLYSAHVEHLGSILNSERRTLRVLFDVTDTEERLRPGMFADVFLGTDAREAVMIPTTAVIHIGLQDYVFTEKSPGVFTLSQVEIAEPIDDNVEVLSGLVPGSRYITNGAILLKPLAVRSFGPLTHPLQERVVLNRLISFLGRESALDAAAGAADRRGGRVDPSPAND